MIHLSELSTAIAKLAMEALIDKLKLTYQEGDDPNIGRAIDEISTAITELGLMNNRTSVHYERLRVAYNRWPPQAHHINSAICENCNNVHIRLTRADDTCFAEAVMDEDIALNLMDSVQRSLQLLRNRQQ